MLGNVRDNLLRVRERIAAAAQRAGRREEDVKLVGVTKYVSSQVARELVAAGVQDLGESRPQELWRKAEDLADLPVRWHFIGHLQRNKIARTLPSVTLVHSGDSLRLLEALSAEGVRLSRPVECLLEINISGDATKHGFTPQEIGPLLPAIASLPQLAVRGLMGMGALDGGRERARRDFIALRELRDALVRAAPAGWTLTELSMGMSEDYDIAVEEGATLVRVGSALFAEGEAPDDLSHV
jgi:pyridoxal phosphate enzyme (YggS family)